MVYSLNIGPSTYDEVLTQIHVVFKQPQKLNNQAEITGKLNNLLKTRQLELAEKNDT